MRKMWHTIINKIEFPIRHRIRFGKMVKGKYSAPFKLMGIIYYTLVYFQIVLCDRVEKNFMYLLSKKEKDFEYIKLFHLKIHYSSLIKLTEN